MLVFKQKSVLNQTLLLTWINEITTFNFVLLDAILHLQYFLNRFPVLKPYNLGQNIKSKGWNLNENNDYLS